MIKRQEQKFFLNFDEIRDLLAQFNAFIAYPNRQINSIYYDTHNMSLYSDGEEGLVPREKYR